jgi:hypothetical protein
MHLFLTQISNLVYEIAVLRTGTRFRKNGSQGISRSEISKPSLTVYRQTRFLLPCRRSISPRSRASGCRATDNGWAQPIERIKANNRLPEAAVSDINIFKLFF